MRFCTAAPVCRELAPAHASRRPAQQVTRTFQAAEDFACIMIRDWRPRQSASFRSAVRFGRPSQSPPIHAPSSTEIGTCWGGAMKADCSIYR